MRRERLWFPFEAELVAARPYDDDVEELRVALKQIDSYMSRWCGTDAGEAEVSIYRLLGWMASRGTMGLPGDGAHEASRGSAASTD